MSAARSIWTKQAIHYGCFVVSQAKDGGQDAKLGFEGFGRLVHDIYEAAGRNDLEYLAQFDFLRTSDPGIEQ